MCGDVVQTFCVGAFVSGCAVNRLVIASAAIESHTVSVIGGFFAAGVCRSALVCSPPA